MTTLTVEKENGHFEFGGKLYTNGYFELETINYVDNETLNATDVTNALHDLESSSNFFSIQDIYQDELDKHLENLDDYATQNNI